MTSYPAFGICGYSGSGKTTLIESLVGPLRARGLKICVIKQDAHGLDIDREGKDTDRLFKAGADIFIRDTEQVFVRTHREADVPLPEVIERVGPYYDLILVEGHKSTPLPRKLWLCKAGESTCPPEAVGVDRVLRWMEDRVPIALAMLDAWLPGTWRATPVYAGILIGGGSTRMGRPKHLLPDCDASRTWVEQVVETAKECVEKVVLLGGGDIPGTLHGLPVLCDVDDAKGPLRGMLAAMRWAPFASWLFLPCDVPLLSAEALQWLLSHRKPGVWAVLPALPGAPAPEPLPGYYDFRAAPLLEHARGPIDLAVLNNVDKPRIPPALTPAWKNVNTPSELEAIGEMQG